MQVELVSFAQTMAIREQRPEAGLIHHSDRGVQCASHDYVRSCRPPASPHQ
ncbi:transposase InsO family protein [Bradyrhizobium sp. USDA 4461]